MNINVSSDRDYPMNCKGMAFFPTNFMLQTPPPPHEEDHHAPPPHHHHPSISWFPQDYHQGTASATSLLGKRSPMSFNHNQEQPYNTGGDDEISSEDIDGSSPQVMLLGEKKKRLSIEQVRTLEKSFELHGNKLEPERKIQLAKAIGLQPRQVAIWFQNRRARWKTKQLEKEYDVLKRHFDAVKADNDALQSQNRKLHAQILALKGRDIDQSEQRNRGEREQPIERKWVGSQVEFLVNYGSTRARPSNPDEPTAVSGAIGAHQHVPQQHR